MRVYITADEWYPYPFLVEELPYVGAAYESVDISVDTARRWRRKMAEHSELVAEIWSEVKKQNPGANP